MGGGGGYRGAPGAAGPSSGGHWGGPAPGGGGNRGGGQWSGQHGGHYGSWHGGGYPRGAYGGNWYGYRGWYGPSVGIYWGGWPYYGYWGGWPYYGYWGGYPVYDSYPVYVPSAPTVYVERSDAIADAPPPAPGNYWYYCPDPAGYYPYVQNCSKPWMTVVPPRPPASGNAQPAAPAAPPQ